MSENQEFGGSRRDFVKSLGAVGATAVLAHGASADDKPAANTSGNEVIKIGLVGCGGRGSGAAGNALTADPRVRIVAAADAFKDRLEGTLSTLRANFGDRIQVPDSQKFVGFDAYKGVMSTDSNYVILATPPYFRPYHIAAAIEAKKHVFTEKPVAVDPWGVRQVLEAGEKAKKLGLSIVAGTQRRHQANYLEAAKMVRDGVLGKIVALRAYWNQTQLWHRTRSEGWSDMEWMIRDWVNWCWLSGDHIVEQHVHNLDVCNWFMTEAAGSDTPVHPVQAVGFGGRYHRPTGDQYDFFSVDYQYADGTHLGSYCRQINDCDRNVSEAIIGEKGFMDTLGNFRVMVGGQNMMQTQPARPGQKGKGKGKGKGKRQAQPAGPVDGKHPDPYVQEHIDLIASITQNGKLNEAANVATSTMTAIMGRVAAYTGEVVFWDKLLASDLKLGPEKWDWDFKCPPTTRPVPGKP